jgi:hypothetical protein
MGIIKLPAISAYFDSVGHFFIQNGESDGRTKNLRCPRAEKAKQVKVLSRVQQFREAGIPLVHVS